MQNDFLLPALYCLLLPAVHADLSTRTIPNWLTFGGIGAGLLLALWQQGGSGVLLASLALFTAFTVAFVFWLCGWLGAGDVKLLAAVATLTGPALLPQVLLFTAFAGGVLAVVAMLWYGRTRDTLQRLRRRWSSAAGADAETDEEISPAPLRLPYAVAIAAGSLLAVLQTGTGLPA
jgi:prepilin peptidase CpaA